MLANIIHDDVNYKSKNDCVNISLRIQRLSQQISLLQRQQSVIGPIHYHRDLP